MIFADNIVLCAENMKDVEFQLEEWEKSMENYGIKISRTKTEYMSTGTQDERVELAGMEIEKVKALGSMLQYGGHY